METARIKAPQKNSVPASAVTESAGSSQSPTSSMQSSPLYAGPPALRLSSSTGGPAQGETLQPQIRSSLESSFQVDMSAVRVHTDARSSAAADSLSARAFTYGPNIFLGSGERPSDLALMAHEGAHVVQQQRVPALQMSTGAASTDTFEQEARQTSLAVQRGEQATVRERTSNPRIQREEKESGGLISRFLDRVVEWVRRIPGYDLVTVILGKDPISGKPVERNAVNVIRGLVSLIPGGHDLFGNLEKAGTIQRAFEWFNTEIGRLNLTWESIKALIRQFWDAFSIWHPIRSIERIGEIFGPVLERLVNFAVAAGKKILEFIFEGVLSLAGSLGKQILGIIRKAGDVFSLIVKDPIGFLKNLVQAVKGGFLNFSKNILKHLKNALFEWLFGALQGAGLILPDKFDFKGIISIILQVVGLTYARLREKLVKLIGEPAVAFIEKAFEFLKIIVTQGIAAAWQKVLEFATGLIDTVIGGIIDWATKTIVGAAITKIVTMFNPVGAIIQGIITIYNTVKFFIERAKQIAAVAEAVFDSIKNIATGNIGGAIEYIEKTMARFLPVVIGFLASFIGLGGIGGEIKKIIQKIQAVIDNAINKVVNFVVDKAKALIGKVTGKKDEKGTGDPEHDAKVNAGLVAIKQEDEQLEKADKTERADAENVAAKVKKDYPVFKSITVVEGKDTWDYDYVASPGKRGGSLRKGQRLAGNLKSIKTAKDTERPLVIGVDVKLATEEAKAIEKVQSFMNELYRKQADHGDGSSEFIAMMEQVRGGVGKDPKPIVGNTFHHIKVREAITHLEGELSKPKKELDLPVEAQKRLRNQSGRLQEALDWIADYKAGNNPSPPRWASGLDKDLYLFAKK